MLKLFKPLAIGLMLMLAVAPLQVQAQSKDFSEAEIKQLALQAILENPEILTQAIAILQQRQDQAQADAATAALGRYRLPLERDSNAPVVGNPDGDVTIVEFFDYNCPFCKQVAEPLKNLLEADGNIRLVYREWPILGEGSEFAARVALASREQGRYAEVHEALMSLPRADEKTVMFAVRKLGLDIDKLREDMYSDEIDSHIQISMELTRALGFNGTPSFVIGDELIGGAITQEQFEEYVRLAREEPGE
jgi:protein-disulfide isomerase